MSDAGSSVTLIFYRMSDRWWTEPVLNLLAAACQMSSLTHVEIALGEAAGSNNTMTNVCRIFNDRVGAVRDARSAIRALPSHSQLRGFLSLRRSSSSAPAKTRSTSTSSWGAPSAPCSGCCGTPRAA